MASTPTPAVTLNDGNDIVSLHLASGISGTYDSALQAKNRLVEVVPCEATSPQTRARAWRFNESIGKTPIHSADAPGFVVNRYFVPWINEAVRLHAEGIDIPTLRDGDASRVALEAYPGLLVRKQLGIRASYKSDTRSEQTAARRAVRRQIAAALREGRPLGMRIDFSSLERRVLADGSGDLLDAVICAAQAAWAAQRPGYGLPAGAGAGEGWIVTA